tara:strand:- start:10593 stop:11003 length:411 start_codon:yes stop_codon:yes gene_type:complete
MATKMKTGLTIAKFRWLSIFNSSRYKDEEDKLNYKMDLNMRYTLANTQLNIAKEVAFVARSGNIGTGPELKEDNLFAKIAEDKIPELEIDVRNLYRELRVAYLIDHIDWNNIIIRPQNRISIIKRMGLEEFNMFNM